MSCRKKLAPIYITEGEFAKLSSAFFDKVVLGKDVFTKSNPQEIEAFKTFLEQSRPYDVVLDGLNVAYGAGRNIAPVDMVSHNLLGQ
jgi:mitochondrial ribonuclease P protein 3